MKEPSINFSKAYKKLDNDEFTTVRWPDKPYRVGRVYTILLRGKAPVYEKVELFKAKCVKIELRRINQLTNVFTQSDADCDFDKFYDMMKRWYSKKPDWRKWLSEVQVIYLQKIDEVKQ